MWFVHTWQELHALFHSVQRSYKWFWSRLAGNYWIVLLWPMILGRLTRTMNYHTWKEYNVSFHSDKCKHTCTGDLTTLDRNLNYHSILTYALWLTYLYKWFDHTWQELKLSFHSDLFFLADILVQVIKLCRNKCIILFWPSLLGVRICTSDLNTFVRNLKYHAFPTYVLRMKYLYKRFDQTFQELNLSFHSELCSQADIPV